MEELEPWVVALRSRLASQPEFKAMSAALYSEVRSSLRADGLPTFGELGPAERQVLIARARAAINDTTIFRDFKETASRELDVALDTEAEYRLSHRAGTLGGPRSVSASAAITAAREDNAGPTGKVGSVVDLAATSAASLLARWPAQPAELLWLLNAAIPPPLRRALWSLKLRAPAGRAAYDRKRSESVLATISLRDGSVLQQCQATLQRVAAPLLGLLPLLKACVSKLGFEPHTVRID